MDAALSLSYIAEGVSTCDELTNSIGGNIKRMLRTFQIALAVSMLASAAFGQGRHINGRWTTTVNHVTGTIDLAPNVTAEIQNGKLEGNELTFDATAPEHGHTEHPLHWGCRR